MIFNIASPSGLKPALQPAAAAQLKERPGSVGPRLTFHWNRWTLAPVALVTSVLAAPYLVTHGLPVLGFALQCGFALVCHQRPERSFWIFGTPVAVCARCLGIYLGTAVGLILRTPRHLAMRILMVAAALNLLDGITEYAGLHGNWVGVRFILGLTAGMAATLLISSALPRPRESSSFSPL